MISHKSLIFHLSTNSKIYSDIFFHHTFSLPQKRRSREKLSFNHERKRREKENKERERNEEKKERRKGKKKPLLVLKLA